MQARYPHIGSGLVSQNRRCARIGKLAVRRDSSRPFSRPSFGAVHSAVSPWVVHAA